MLRPEALTSIHAHTVVKHALPGTVFIGIKKKKLALQEDFTPMMSATLEKAARNVLMDLLFTLTRRREHQSKIASPVQKVVSN